MVFTLTANIDIFHSKLHLFQLGVSEEMQYDDAFTMQEAAEFHVSWTPRGWMRKDLDITLRTARSVNARLPLAALVDQFYADVQAYGGARWDTSSLIERLRRS